MAYEYVLLNLPPPPPPGGGLLRRAINPEDDARRMADFVTSLETKLSETLQPKRRQLQSESIRR